MFTHQSYFDALNVCDRLQRSVGSVATAEIHLFAYIACLLSLYRGRPVGEWGYHFAVTNEGYPYSPEIDSALRSLTANRSILVAKDDFLMLSQIGGDEIAELNSLATLRDRIPFLESACECALILPIGSIRTALAQEVNIRGALLLAQARLLLTGVELDLLYEQFEVLTKAIGVNVDDLMVPAVVWITYLSEVGTVTETKA